MKEIIQEIDLTSKKLQQAIADADFTPPPKDARLSHAIRSLLASKGDKTIEGYFGYRQKAREWRKKMKAYSFGAANGPGRDLYRMIGVVQERFFVQDYLPEVQVSERVVNLQQVGTDNLALSDLTNEGTPKAARTFSHATYNNILNKVALTVIYTDEALTFLGDRLAAFLEMQIALGLEHSMSNGVVATMLTNSVVFATAPYASSVTQANFVDLINLMILQEEELALHETMTQRSVTDLVLLSNPAWQRLCVLKNTQGVRLYDSYEQAVMANDMLGYPNVTVISNSALTDTALVVRSAEWPVAVVDGLRIYNDRIVESTNDTNHFRFTAEIYFVPVYTRRLGSTNGYARRATISTAVAAINQP